MIHYGKKISFCIHIQYKSSSPHHKGRELCNNNDVSTLFFNSFDYHFKRIVVVIISMQ